MKNKLINKNNSHYQLNYDEKPQKMTVGYMYKNYKMLVFQSITLILIITILFSGLMIYGANTEAYEKSGEESDSMQSVERGVNIFDALPTAEYEEEPIEYLLSMQKKYNVKYINQIENNMPGGCEIVSLAMILNRYLPDLTPREISEKYLPRMGLPVYSDGIYTADDPTDYYIGNPAEKGYGIFAPGLAVAAQNAIDANGLVLKAYDISGCSEDELLEYISKKVPVIVWTTIDLYAVNWGIMAWHLPSGKLYKWPGNRHCCVLVDYTDTTVTVFDPIRGIVENDRNLFTQRWNEMGPYADQTRQAVVIK